MSNDEVCKNIDTKDQKKEEDQSVEKSTEESSSPWAKMEKKENPSKKRGWYCGLD